MIMDIAEKNKDGSDTFLLDLCETTNKCINFQYMFKSQSGRIPLYHHVVFKCTFFSKQTINFLAFSFLVWVHFKDLVASLPINKKNCFSDHFLQSEKF